MERWEQELALDLQQPWKAHKQSISPGSMKSRKTWAFGETHIADSFLCELLQWHKYIKHLELLDCCFYSAQWQKTETNAEEILEKKKKVKWRWCRKVWSAIALPAKSGHRRPLYFNLCSLSSAVRLRSSSCCSRSREGAAVSRADGRAVLLPATLWREERAGKERLPQQGPLTAKTDSGWQEQKLSSYTRFSSTGMEQKWKNRTRKKS